MQASWNGGTQVASWAVLARPWGHLVSVATARKPGFQTTLHVGSSAPDVAAQALGGGGAVLGTSARVAVGR